MDIPINRPHLPPYEEYIVDLRELFKTGQVTNGPYVRELETALAHRLGVREVVAVTSATAGLMLCLRALAPRDSEVLLPSFTFAATLQAVLWAGLKPRLVDCEPDTFTISARTVERALTPGSKVLIPVYVFGAPLARQELDPLIQKAGLIVISDAAHALGSMWGDEAVGGWGAAEIFSLAPTKLLVAAEGGVVATNDSGLARKLRAARNHGHEGDYQCNGDSLNGRMSEFHALLALKGLPYLDDQIKQRKILRNHYAKGLEGYPGLTLQILPPKTSSTWNYIGVRFDKDRFGAGSEEAKSWLADQGIESRRYFHPPLHRQTAFQYLWQENPPDLPGTDRLVSEILCLPLFSEMKISEVDRVVQALDDLHKKVR
ncbi:MAG: DegT/DnrJ/EryC1/StrS family aminotransferase [Candidatus Eisenbacteria bacterium]|nr:DegT/DnrJ/EryC1/StrS family aminotransferase [Candidatus Eisenbacteria bacterium]MBU1949003.1 DegT/DnrJ/EryC1/StrS family aminotransferase [Candidatus Eisenbacteria bacterium]